MCESRWRFEPLYKFPRQFEKLIKKESWKNVEFDQIKSPLQILFFKNKIFIRKRAN